MKKLFILGILIRLTTCDSLFYRNATCWTENKYLNTVYLKSGYRCFEIVGEVKLNKVVSISKCSVKPYGAEDIK